ncbi:peptidase domain-containing ABC transporter [Psychrobium sp. 1_MG-2023]|uniref:peptidase domain-containing ABC transporter n=1 Tax=Psychrobium sp. 1_MG-2023 TaxID=3062624 RepID=UPI000C3304A3|nr:peptidase domain-containing ABC transporter [Psychrobium sp. 1_MG-2023]MDP2560470.1 peptidase domain-containing ABC transporter [Psychrobium sp. 1_MG-2023]PKF57870.1 ABC transporter ATP-binding protein [Alteromonadales bacterium alter-6D02]
MTSQHIQGGTEQQSYRLLEFSNVKRVPLILQAEVAECGLASMAMIASYFGHQLDMAAMRQRFSTNLKGMSLQQVIDLGGSLGLASRALQCPIEEINKLKLPCILHWDMNHFVVLTKASAKKVTINDPAQGKRTLNFTEFSQHFTGVALELTPTATFKKKARQPQMRLSQLWSKITGFKSALVKLFALSLVLQVFALAVPYYMQWVVDEVLISRDQSLLTVLALGFGMLCLITVFTTVIRSWLVLRLSSLLNIQMGVNVLHHLLRLPMSYFENRHIGDIVSRFGSLAQIRERITTGFVETVVDGVMSITVLVMMFIYNIKLTLIVLAVVTIYTGVRLALYRPLHQATEDSIQNQAKEQSNFLETIRGIQTIKLFSNESQRQSIWQNRYAEVVNADIRLGKLHISFDAFNKLLFGIENVLIIYFAALFVMSGSLSVGMILAFIAYKGQFIQRASNLIEQIIQFKIMRLHLERIADIALHQQEPSREGVLPATKLQGHLSLVDVCFRYDSNDKYVLNKINLEISAGECIAITGDSGCGKTTLVKVILGLLKPSSGTILLDGQDITQIGLKNYRQQVGAVMQSDNLFAGSVLDNITFFNPEPNYLKVERCAKLAAIDQDISQMPMGYNTLVGDMGSTLSGGQLQRVLLARALYNDPLILVMDEATSHLDSHNEQIISQRIKHLAMTRVVIAHRQETIAQVNTVYRLDNGMIELTTPQSYQINLT